MLAEDVSVRETLLYLHTLRARLPIFVVTDHPSDQPDYFVARLHLSLPAHEALPLHFKSHDLEQLRECLEGLGLVHLDRSPSDDPVILEVWM